MDRIEATIRRHAVRSFTNKKIDLHTVAALQAEIAACNAESGLHIQLFTEEPDAFGNLLAHYGKFRQVRNYLALIGKKSSDLHEKVGYYGERLVLTATMLGLDSCWVALTFSKGKSKGNIEHGEKRVCVIALGYGETHGVPHKSKPLESLCKTTGPMPCLLYTSPPLSYRSLYIKPRNSSL